MAYLLMSIDLNLGYVLLIVLLDVFLYIQRTISHFLDLLISKHSKSYQPLVDATPRL